MTVAVTGAGGHIGGNLIRALLDQGRKVRAIIRSDKRALEGLDVEIVKADVLDADSLEKAFTGAETVFHLAAQISIMGDPGGMVSKINVHGPRNVVAACLKTKVPRLVHCSSVHAHNQHPLDQPLDETRDYVSPPKALAYDLSKANGEREILAGIRQGLDAVIINPTGVIGPCDFKPSRMGKVFIDMFTRRLTGLVEGGFDWVDVRDVVAGALAAEKKGRTGEKYLLSGHWVSVKDLGDKVRQVTRIKPPWFVSPMWLARVGAPFGEIYSRITGAMPLFTRESLAALRANKTISHKKAAEELGYAPRPTEQSIKDIHDWFHKAGMLDGK